MDDYKINEQILLEVRKQNGLYRKSLIISCVFMAAIILYILAFPYYLEIIKPPQQEASWEQVRSLVDRGNYVEAERIGLNLLKKTPADYYSHACLANLYSRKGDLPRALTYAETAYRLNPDKINEETLQALKKRIESVEANKSKPSEAPF